MLTIRDLMDFLGFFSSLTRILHEIIYGNIISSLAASSSSLFPKLVVPILGVPIKRAI